MSCSENIMSTTVNRNLPSILWATMLVTYLNKSAWTVICHLPLCPGLMHFFCHNACLPLIGLNTRLITTCGVTNTNVWGVKESLFRSLNYTSFPGSTATCMSPRRWQLNSVSVLTHSANAVLCIGLQQMNVMHIHGRCFIARRVHKVHCPTLQLRAPYFIQTEVITWPTGSE